MRENGLTILFNTVFIQLTNLFNSVLIHVYDFVLLEGMEQ